MVKRLGTRVGSYYACFDHNYKFIIIFQRTSVPLNQFLKCCGHRTKCTEHGSTRIIQNGSVSKCVQNYGTVCYPGGVYNLLCMIHSILWAVVGTMHYGQA